MPDNSTVTLIAALGGAIGGGFISFMSNLTLERLRARREDRRQHRIADETAARELRDLCYQATDTAEALREARRAAEAVPPPRSQPRRPGRRFRSSDPEQQSTDRQQELERLEQRVDGLLCTIERRRQDLSDKRLRASMCDVTTALRD